MKINIRENEIKGDVQDGSVDLVQEFEEKLQTIRRELDGWPEPVLPDVFGDEIHKVGLRISFDFDGGEKLIRWQIKGYFKELAFMKMNGLSYKIGEKLAVIYQNFFGHYHRHADVFFLHIGNYFFEY